MNSRRSLLFAGAAGALLVVTVAVGIALRDRNVPVTVSPSPTATATPTSTATASPSPSPVTQGAYTSKPYGYALALPPSWHRAICGNIETRTLAGEIEQREQFTSEDPMAEFIGHVGYSGHRVEVHVRDNPRSLSPMEFTGGRSPVGGGAIFGPDGVRSTTFAGRPAAEFGVVGGPVYGYLVGDGGRVYIVFYRTHRIEPDRAAAAVMLPIVRSFRFLGASERQALPDPTPIPATGPSAQALAASLKTALEGKDVAALERLLGPCVNNGVQNGGGSLVTRQRFAAELRTQFAAGLAVTVDPGQMRMDDVFGDDATLVRSRWNAFPPGQGPVPSPGAQTLNVELILQPTRGGFYWRGTLVLGPG